MSSANLPNHYRGILIVPYDSPSGWVMWCDEERDAADVAPNIKQARQQIDEHLDGFPGNEVAASHV